jgi:hypothetical protein
VGGWVDGWVGGWVGGSGECDVKRGLPYGKRDLLYAQKRPACSCARDADAGAREEPRVYVCVCVRVYVCGCVRLCACACALFSNEMFIYCSRFFTYMTTLAFGFEVCVRVYVCLYVCACMCASLSLSLFLSLSHAHIHTHTHTHTHSLSLSLSRRTKSLPKGLSCSGRRGKPRVLLDQYICVCARVRARPRSYSV